MAVVLDYYYYYNIIIIIIIIMIILLLDRKGVEWRADYQIDDTDPNYSTTARYRLLFPHDAWTQWPSE